MKKFSLLIICLCFSFLFAQERNLNNTKVDGYKGIWFELNQPYEFGDKYSGGLGTYTAKHRPLAIYAEEVDKTFFVYGGTPNKDEKYLLCMVGYYDHKREVVAKPTVVHDKEGVDDPHDNPSLLIDKEGYIWVFVSGRSTLRMGYKYRSEKPYDIESFQLISEEEITYPQPWINERGEILHLFTKYTGVRELYFESSTNGKDWSEVKKLAGIKERGQRRGGHYQMSTKNGDVVGTFFNRHPKGDPDRRTDLYYAQTNDLGKTWTAIDGKVLQTPLEQVASPARVINYYQQKKNVYLKDMIFDENGYPIALYVTSRGHEPGPVNNPREFRVTYWNGDTWETYILCETDHNYDMGSLYLEDDAWTVIIPSIDGPQHYGTGGEIAMWKSINKGKNWKLTKQLTINSERNHGYIRRPEQARDPFYFFWADGDPEKMSISKIYFGSSDGRIFILPYEMEKDFEKPVEFPQK